MKKQSKTQKQRLFQARFLITMLLVTMLGASSGFQVLAEALETEMTEQQIVTETEPIYMPEDIQEQPDVIPTSMDDVSSEVSKSSEVSQEEAAEETESEEILEENNNGEAVEPERVPEETESEGIQEENKAEEVTVPEGNPEGSAGEEVTESEENPEGSAGEEVTTPEGNPEGSVGEEVTEPEENPEGSTGEEVTTPEGNPEGSAGEEVTSPEEIPEGSAGEEATEPEENPEGAVDGEDVESEETTETEETVQEEAVLDMVVIQEVFQKTVEDKIQPMIKYNITVRNLSDNENAENISVKAIVSPNASYINEAGETAGIIYYPTLNAAVVSGILGGEEVSAEKAAQYAEGEVIMWNNISLSAGAEQVFTFFAVPAEGVVDTVALTSVWIIDGKEVNDYSKIQWYGTDLLFVVEEELVEDIELPTEFVYENDNMIVTAVLSEGTILPEGAVFVVEEMTLSAEEIGLIEETLSEEQELQGYAVYDMRFEVDGQEVEPENGMVTVSVEYKETIQLENTEADAEVTEYKVLHLDETSEGTAVEDVTEHVSGTVEGQVDALGFTTDSFSPIVLVGVGMRTASMVSSDKYNRSYSLENFLTGYNVVAFGDVNLNLHCMGGIICEGNLNLNASGFADGTGLPPSYVKGYLSSSYGRYSSRSGVNEPLYVGSSNTVTEIQNGDKKLAVVNGVTYWENGGDIKVYISDDYFDFGRAKSVIDGASSTLMANSLGSVDKNGSTIRVQAGTKVKIDSLDGISCIDIVGDVSKALNTVINITVGGSVNLPQMNINGSQPSVQEQDSVGTSIVWNIPYASSVKIPSMNWVGHVIAQNAAVSMDSGNYNGCIICDSFVTAAEGHMYAYNGGSLTAAQAKIAVVKTLNGKEIISGSKEDKLFTFTLKQTAAPDGVTKEGDRIVKNNGSNVSFGTFNYVTAGTYTYEITETAEVSGYTIDGKTIEVIVEIQNAGNNSFAVKSITYKEAGKNVILTNPAFDNKTTVVEEEKINVKGTKTWVDGNNQDGIRPESIVVNLLADGVKVASKEVKVSEDGSWTYVFEGLAKNKDGKEIKYTVTEEAVAGYETKVEGYDITNTHKTETTSVKGTKTWVDGNDQDGIRPSSIIVNLLADGVKVASQEVKASEDGSWTYVFENLAKNKDGKEIKYTVTEEAVAGYEAKVEGYDITNTHVTGTVRVSGTKIWEDGNNQDGIRPSSIIVNLLADGVKVASQEVKASEDGSWTYVFENLAKNKDGKEIKYTVTEETVAGYETKVEGYDITNIHKTETTSVKGTKIWVDENNQDGIRPSSIIVNLLADGVKVASQEVKASEDGSWTYVFENLAKNKDGKEIKYTVTEEAVAGYEAKVEGYDITNTHKTETTSVKGTKTWVDENNQDGIRPESIVVNLLADGVKVASQEVKASEDGSWTYSFGEYDKYKDGKEIVYTVTEEVVEGYEVTIDGYNLINTHEVETVEVSAEKNWDDNDNQDGVRPEVVKLQLLANGEAVGEPVELTAEDDWTYIWENLAKNEAGTEIIYTVEEVEIPDGYTCTIEGNSKDGFTVSNCHEAIMVEKTVDKVWNDDNSNDRPSSISVQLFGNGKEIGDMIVLSDAEGWTYTWKNLPKYEAGKEITYTVKELEVAEGYAPSYTVDGDTLTIMNNLIAEDASVVVMKQLIYAGEEVNAVDQTFYVALYYDEECTQIASDVKAIEFKNASSSSVTFDNLGNGATYYVGECDADGNAILVGETETGEIFAANFNDGNSFVVEDGMETYIFFENEFFTLPDGFYKIGELNVTKKMADADGAPMESDEVFYAGIFADKELTTLSEDVEYNILELALDGESEVTVTTNVYLPFDGSSLTLYVAEVDEDGVVVETSDVFPYKVSVSEEAVVYEYEELSESVVIINQEIEEEVEEEDKDKEKEEEKTETKEAVETGDDTPIVLYVLILLLALVGIVSAFVIKSRKNKR